MDKILKTYKNQWKRNRTKRKHLLNSITSELRNFKPKSEPKCRYSLPSRKCSLAQILSSNFNKNISIQDCYMYKCPDNKNNNNVLVKQLFRYGEYFCAENPFQFVLPHIKKYITEYDSRVNIFLQTLYISRWQLVLHILLSGEILDQHNKKIQGENYIHLDNPSNYIIERLFLYNVRTKYFLCHLFHHLSDVLNQSERNESSNDENLLKSSEMDIHCVPYQNISMIDSSKRFISVRFYFPKDIFSNDLNNCHEIDENILRKEKNKMS